MAVNEVAENFKTRGNQALQTREYNEAVFYYTKAIETDPANPAYFSNRAAARLHLREFSEALEDANEAIHLKSSFVRAYGRKSDALYGLKRFSEAVEAARAGLALDPTNQPLQQKLSLARRSAAQGSSTNTSAPSSSSTSPNVPTNDWMKFLVADRAAMIRTGLAALRFWIALNFVMYMLSSSYPAYRRIMMFAGGLNIYYMFQEVGLPKFNREYLGRLFTMHSFFMLLHVFVIFTVRPHLIALFPIIIFEFVHLGYWLTEFLGVFSAPAGAQLSQVGFKIGSMIVSNNNYATMSPPTRIEMLSRVLLQWAALSQILYMGFLLVELLTPARNLLALFLCFQMLRLEYIALPHARAAFGVVDQYLLGGLSHPWSPAFLRGYYQRVRAFMQKLGNPTPPTQSQSQGGLSGLASNCSIM